MNDLYRERASAGEGERDRRASRRLRGRVFRPFLCSASAVYMLNNFGAPGSVYVYVCMCVCGVCVCAFGTSLSPSSERVCGCFFCLPVRACA